MAMMTIDNVKYCRVKLTLVQMKQEITLTYNMTLPNSRITKENLASGFLVRPIVADR